jgi:hypothetical protein
VVNASEKTFRGLRRFNAVMGVLHLVLSVLMIVLSNDTTYPIYSNVLRLDLDNFALTPDPKLTLARTVNSPERAVLPAFARSSARGARLGFTCPESHGQPPGQYTLDVRLRVVAICGSHQA